MEHRIQGSMVAYLADTPFGLSHLYAARSGRTPSSRATYGAGDATIMGLLRSPHQRNSHHSDKRLPVYLSTERIRRISDNWSGVDGGVCGLFMETLGPGTSELLSFPLKSTAPFGGACR